jgi:hypothetical protein
MHQGLLGEGVMINSLDDGEEELLTTSMIYHDHDSLENKLDDIDDNISQLNSDLSKYDNFNYTLISQANYNYGDTTNSFDIPNDTLLVRARFWIAGKTDPQFCYLNFDRRINRFVQIAEHFEPVGSNPANVRMTVDVNWMTMKVTIVSNTLPNSNWHIGIQFYK